MVATAAVLGVFVAAPLGIVSIERLHDAGGDERLGALIGYATWFIVVATWAAIKLRSARRRVKFGPGS